MEFYNDFLNLGIDLAQLGLAQGENTPYYCTPQGAQILGWAGVDGIHYCTVKKFGAMVFAVNPMNAGDCVYPIAESFVDLLRLLLACGDMAALEQCHGWEEEQFRAFLRDNPITPEQKAVLDEIREKCGLLPMDNPYGYIKQLQRRFNYGQIPYSKEYYDLDMNPVAPAKPEKWKVYFEGNFWCNGRGKGWPGKETVIGKGFCWGQENWLVPAVYLCLKGLVVDFCVEISPERIKAFIDKWKIQELEEEELTQKLREQIEMENPLNIDFRPVVQVNGETLMAKSGCAVSWIPQSCLPEGERNELEAESCLAHYGLDKSRGWVVCRWNFPWVTAQRPKLKYLQIELKRELTKMEGIHFFTPEVGEEISFTHPVTGQTHKLTVLACEAETLAPQPWRQGEFELPNHCVTMTYRLEPELSDRSFRVLDCEQSDAPRVKSTEGSAETNASTIGIIGGADGPTAVTVVAKETGRGEQTHTAISALHFEPQRSTQWHTVFYEKLMEDKEVTLLL